MMSGIGCDQLVSLERSSKGDARVRFWNADGEEVDFSGQEPLGACPKCGAPVYAHGSSYVCSHAVPTLAQQV